jgi:hypothetical protein
VSKEVLSRRAADYQNWVEAFARNHGLPIEWAEKGVRKEDHVLPWLRRMTRTDRYGVYFIFKSIIDDMQIQIRQLATEKAGLLRRAIEAERLAECADRRGAQLTRQIDALHRPAVLRPLNT